MLHGDDRSLQDAARENAVDGSRRDPERQRDDHDDGLLATAIPLMLAAYGGALAIAALTFIGSGEAVFAIVVCVVYGAMYFGLPILMARMRKRHDKRWEAEHAQRYADRVSVFGGTIRRTEALLQMVIVPFAVFIAFAAFAVIWWSVRL